MGQVNATICGRQVRLACEDGQEDHLLALAKDVDTRIIDLRRKFGEIGDTRLTVMAALMLADEMAEMDGKLKRLQGEITALEQARAVSAERAREASEAVVGAFNSAAERIESITRKLNQTVGDSQGVLVG
jgi:cell division protein ZapA